MGEKLGQPFMPWQSLVADVGGEINPETGLPAYREVRVTVPRQSGKSLSVDTEVFTANRGWVTMGSIRVGDEIYDAYGQPTLVTAATDVMYNHSCYRIRFSDGTEIVADADHLWLTWDLRARKAYDHYRGASDPLWPYDWTSWTSEFASTVKYDRGERTRMRDMRAAGLTAAEIGKVFGRSADAIMQQWNRPDVPGASMVKIAPVTTAHLAQTVRVRGYSNHAIPAAGALDMKPAELPIDPYVLGYLLGDGDTRATGRVACDPRDRDWLSVEFRRAGFMTRRPSRDPGHFFVLGIGSIWRGLGLDGGKFIPDVFLRGSREQRIALAQGLVDSDGTVDKKGSYWFDNTNRALVDGFVELVTGLGCIPRIYHRAGRVVKGRLSAESWSVLVSTEVDLARIPRKADRARRRWNREQITRFIVAVEPVESVPVRCIAVDSDSRTYLAGRGLIPTHNTTLFLSWQINRCVSRRWSHPQRSVFTAQTGKDARDKWIDELFPLIRQSQLKSLVAVKGSRLEINEGMGNESIRFKTGSRIRLLSTATTSGHSKTLHQAVMDEVWHDTDDRREQGLRPAMITIDDAQLLVCSTAGTETSVVLNRKVETGRAAVLADTGTGVAYFEWSAPDGWDPFDEESYYTFMPALCPYPPCRCAGQEQNWHHTITSLDAIRDEREEMGLAGFRRAYGNVAAGPQTKPCWLAIKEQDWLDAEDPTTPAKQGLSLSLYVNPESTYSAICAAWDRDDGDMHTAVFHHDAGVGWTIPRMVELCIKWKPSRVVVDPAGAVGAKLAELETELKPLGLEVTPMKARDVAAAYGMFRNGITAEPDPDLPAENDAPNDEAPAEIVRRRLRVRPMPVDPPNDPANTPLALAAKNGTTRFVGGGKAWEWKSDTDLSTLMAATNAVWGLVTCPAEALPVTIEGRLFGDKTWKSQI